MTGLANGGLIAIDAGMKRWPGNPLGRGFVAAVSRLPHGFLEERYANGLAVCYIAYHNGVAHASIASHPARGSLTALSKQWAPSSLDDGLSIVDEMPDLTAVMASQEVGEFAYVIYRRGKSAVTGSGSTFGTSEHVVRFNQTTYAEARYHHPFTGGADVIYSLGGGSAFAEFYPEHLFELGYWNSSLHVSDTFPPQLWFVGGDRMIYWVDADDPQVNQAPYAQRWKRRENIISTANGFPHKHGPWRLKFQGGHYLQRYQTRPDERGPILVRPWSNSTTQPELWFIVRKDSGYEVYRASWKPGEWVLPESPYGPGPNGETHAVIEDHGGGDYPQFNPNGYAFEHDWRKKDNLIGRITGHPRGGDLMSSEIKVVRDHRRRDRLYLIITDDNMVQWATSNNDGATWSRFQRMGGRPIASGAMSSNLGHIGKGDVDRYGRIIVPGSNTIRSLMCMTRSGAASESGERPYVYRRGEATGSVWL